MRVADIPEGMPFRWGNHQTIYISRGNGWYDTPSGRVGGPWHSTTAEDAEPVLTALHACSFEGFTNSEVVELAKAINADPSRTEGDKALTAYVLRCRGV